MRVQTRAVRNIDAGMILGRPDDDHTLYGETFEPLRTHQAFRACSAYERIAREAA